MKRITLMKVAVAACSALAGWASGFAQTGPAKTLTLAWDTSLSMEANQPVYALRYFEAIIAANPDCQVRLLCFSSEVEETKFAVRGGDWSALRAYLEHLTYDGAAYYGGLAASLDASETYLYTDGKQVLPSERLPVEKGYTILSRATGAEQHFLERSALLYRGDYVQLTPYAPPGDGSALPAGEAGGLKGRIFLDNKPASGLLVQRKGAPRGTTTDAEGWYHIDAAPGDTLQISGGAFALPLERAIPAEGEPSLFLDSRVIALEEVEVSQKRRRDAPDDTADIGYGQTDKDRLGVAVQSIDDEQISAVTTDVSKAIQGKFSGVQVGQEDDISKVTMRTNNTMLLNNYGLIVIDGVPMQQGDSSGKSPQAAFNFVDPENIADITVLKGMAATTRYGTLGANGVILITTKNAVYGTGQTAVEDRARLRNNTYTGEGLSAGNTSAVQEALAAAPAGTAYPRYLELRAGNQYRPGFYLDAYEFFKKRDPARAARIATNLLERDPENPHALQTVLRCLAELGQTDLAMAVAESLATLQPGLAPALLYQASVTQDRRVLGELVRKLILLKNGLDASKPLMGQYAEFLEKEIKRLVFARRFDLDMRLIPEKYHTCPTYKARVVFDWNQPGAEFVIQSVNPKKKFYDWQHSNDADPGLIREELQTGVAFKDFDLYGPDSTGDWIFNVELLGLGPDAGGEPLVVGCRIYQNFGTAQETSEYVTLHLSEPGEKQNLVNLRVN